MADLTLTRSGELMLTQVEGNTDAGVEFVDAWVEPVVDDMYVHDAGVIFVRDTVAIVKAARVFGLTIEHDVIATEKADG